MNIIELQKPPLDLDKYTKIGPSDSFEFDEKCLLELLAIGSSIAAEGFALETITKLERQILANGYQIQFVKIDGMTSFANFYLKRH